MGGWALGFVLRGFVTSELKTYHILLSQHMDGRVRYVWML